LIAIVSGPGGVGKGSVVDRLLEIEPGIQLSRSWTTRPKRPGELDDAYVFVDRDAFEKRIADEGFLEWTRYPGTGHLYGTPTLDDVSDEGGGGAPTVLEIELDGAQQVKAVHPDAILILIVAPSIEARAQRLRKRGDDEQSVTRRLDVGAEEEELGRRLADHVVVNDDLNRAAEEVAGILRGHQAGR
jgi:guanylate kinase